MAKSVLHTSDYVCEDEYIHINQCGIMHCKDKPANAIRSNGRKDYLFLYVLNGTCILNHNSDNPTVVEKGNVILFKPDEPQYYKFPKENNSVQVYIHFSGYGCEELFKSAAITESIIKPKHQNELEYYLQRICEIFDFKDNRTNMQCGGLLIACLGLIAAKQVSDEYVTQKYHKQISYIIGKIQTEPHLNYSVEEWANQCNISTAQFINVFKSTTGYSPYQYLTRARISYAKELLLFSDFGISEIGQLCGYDEPNYFTRVFKKSVGLTPSEFKKKERT